MVNATVPKLASKAATWGGIGFPKPPIDVFPLLSAVVVGCVAGVWASARTLMINPEVCCTKEYREGGSLYDEKAILSKADGFRPFPYFLRDMRVLGRASTPEGVWQKY